MIDQDRNVRPGKLVTPGLLQVQVYDLLRHRIAACRPGYEPGEQLNMSQVAAELEISITPVKDAVKRLQADGLVITKPRQGIFVRELSNAELHDLLAVRRGLEVLAADLFRAPLDPRLDARMAAELVAWEHERGRGDVQAAYAHHFTFHSLMVEASGNRLLARMYQQLHAHLLIAFVYYTQSFNQTDDEILRHRRLLDALRATDFVAVRRSVDEHYKRGRPIIGPEGEIPLASPERPARANHQES
jgi:DNA-binding GntR family transcriptional regulator